MSDQSYGKSAKQLPSPEEIEAMVVFPGANNNVQECQVLCRDLQDTADARQLAESDLAQLKNSGGSAKDIAQAQAQVARLTARLKALNRQMGALHCGLCHPQ